MYDLPALRPVNDLWWAALRDRLRAAGIANAPESRIPVTDRESHWTDPALLFSQTCGYPLLFALGAAVELVATPCYDASGCDGPDYSSVLLVREDAEADELADLRGTTVTYNGADSQSGYNCLRVMVAPLARDGRFFQRAWRSGGHLESAAAVAAGEADVCAVDCVTWALAERTGAAPSGLRILQRSPSAPSLPWITAAGQDRRVVAALREALADMMRDAALAPVREALALKGMAVLPLAAYEPIRTMADAALRSGYPALR